MDTKSKRYYKSAILIMLVVVMACAGLMTAMYPYINQKMQEYNQEHFSDGSLEAGEASEFAVDVVNCNYGLWDDYTQRGLSSKLTGAEVFLDMDNDAYYQDGTYDLINDLNYRASLWVTRCDEIKPSMSYTMTDIDGKVLMSAVGDNYTDTADTVKVTLSYDDAGKMSISYADTGVSENKDLINHAFLTGFEYYTVHDPIETMGYDGLKGVFFDGPKNVTYEYKFVPSEMFTEERNISMMEADIGFLHVAVSVAALLPIALVVLLALIVFCIRPLGIDEIGIFHAPLGIVVLIGVIFLGCLLTPAPAYMVYLTNDGTVWRELMKAGCNTDVAAVLAWFGNWIIWGIGLLVLYWCVTCVMTVFRLGPARYLRERTLIGVFFLWLWSEWKKFFTVMTTIDWHDNSTKQMARITLINFIILAVISCFWFFGIIALVIYSIFVFWWLTRYYNNVKREYDVLLDALGKIAEGDLGVEITDDIGVFNPIKQQLKVVQSGFRKAVDKEVESQKMKTELITNVSHDLKTPLTAIITYVNLLKDDNIDDDTRKKYVEILEKKSLRLKALIEDLFDVSKANSGNMTVDLADVDIVNLIKEVKVELDDKISESGVDFRWNLPEEKVILKLDSQKTYRIFENLIVNITKYALPSSRAYITLEHKDEKVEITLTDVSASEIHVRGDKLTERFVRGDESRGIAEGSGLGLAIARSFTEIQGGTMQVSVDGDLFKVQITFTA